MARRYELACRYVAPAFAAWARTPEFAGTWAAYAGDPGVMAACVTAGAQVSERDWVQFAAIAGASGIDGVAHVLRVDIAERALAHAARELDAPAVAALMASRISRSFGPLQLMELIAGIAPLRRANAGAICRDLARGIDPGAAQTYDPQAVVLRRACMSGVPLSVEAIAPAYAPWLSVRLTRDMISLCASKCSERGRERLRALFAAGMRAEPRASSTRIIVARADVETARMFDAAGCANEQLRALLNQGA